LTRLRPYTDSLPAPEGRRFQLSLDRDGPLLVFCAALCMVWCTSGERERGERGSRQLRKHGRCALTASRKNGPPAIAGFSLAP